MDLGISGRRAIVCASRRRLGRSCAEALRREGVNIVINGRASDSLEIAALRLARDSALVPNLVEAEHFAELRKHFDEPQVVELVAVCSLFGFLNRWNDTMSTELESVPRAFADRHLGSSGWEVGKHR